MKRSGGSIVVRALEDEGISLAFGIPGTHNVELYDALAASGTVRTVLVTDEQSASFMADGAWRASGELACLNVVPGAGLTHAFSGIVEAFLDQVPMLVLGCGIRRDTGRAFQLHDVDQEAIVAPVVKATFRPETGADLYPAIRRACAVARDGAPGPVFVEVPANLYLSAHEVNLPRGPERGTTSVHPPAPDEALLARADKLIQQAKRPLLYVGAGAAGAVEEVRALAELLEAPVSTTFQGKGVFPEEHPLFLWPGFGATAPPFVRDVVAGCDLTLAIGCRFGEVGTGSWETSPPGALVHVDIDADALGRNFPADVAIVSDAGSFLRSLLGLLGDEPRGEDPELRERIRTGHARVWAEWLEHAGGDRVTPAYLLRTAQRVFGPETIYTTDSGNGTLLGMECLRLEAPRRFLAPVDYSCMGYAVPAALGAKLARPDAPVVALSGDGAFLMTGLEVLTAVAERIGVVVLVLRDRELGEVAQFQAEATNRKVSSRVHDYDLRAIAAGLGVAFLSIERDEEVEATLLEAERLNGAGTPVLVEVAVDYGRRTFFGAWAVKASLRGLPVRDQMRFVGRSLVRRITG